MTKSNELESLRAVRARISAAIQTTHNLRSEALVEVRELLSWVRLIEADLTTRRARDAEVEALVKTVIEYRFALQEHANKRTTQARAIDAELALNAALAPFTGAKP